MLIYRLIARMMSFLQPSIAGGEGGEGNSGGGSNTPSEGSDGNNSGDSGSGSGSSGEQGTEGGGEPGAGTDEGAEEVVLKVGEEEIPPAEEAKPWVKELRKKFKDQSQELARLRSGQPAPVAGNSLPPAPGAKPKINDPDIDYDPDKLALALEKWYEASNKHNDAKRRLEAAQEEEQRSWQSRVAKYNEVGKSLGFADFEDCEAAALTILSDVQQKVIVGYAESEEKAALIMYAIGRNPSMAQELAKIDDPIRFAMAINDLQRKLVMIKRKPGTKPEPTLPASATSASAALAGEDKKLIELREEAARTGSMDKLLAYQRQQRQKAAQRRPT